jgi:glycine cleavage system T protein (aminomethyltransferase)
MMKTTPFYERLAERSASGLWGHWSGYLSALRYDMSAKHEYFAIRNSAGLFDTSPLFKYWIRGRDAERFLAGILTRDIRACRPGRAQYTVWSDDRGFVLEDGVFFRHSDNEFFFTAARPNLGYFTDLIGRLQVEMEDVSEDYGVLALQGPRSRKILDALIPDLPPLEFFGLCQTKLGSTPVTISRTGYTGDLGFEVVIPTDHALPCLDAVLDAGAGYGLRLFGEDALMMARVEAGLVLIDVDFTSSRLAFTDADRVTAKELGFGWMLRGVQTDDRSFIGRDAIRRELADKTSRWSTVGLLVDWEEYARLYNAAGLLPPKDEAPLDYETMLYRDGKRVGYATSLMYSPVLQRHIGMARVRPEAATLGSSVDVELTINHEYQTVPAEVARLPLFNPERKTGPTS